MKFNEIPERLKKILYFLVAIIFFVCFCFSCVSNPLKASASGEGEVSQVVRDFWDVYWQNSNAIINSIIHDIQSGNTSATSDIAKQRLKQIGIQMLIKQYDPKFWYLDYPDQFTFDSVSGSSGYYISANDGFYHPVFVNGVYPYEPETSITSAVEWTLCSSDEFTVTGIYTGDQARLQTATSSSGSYSGIRLYPVSGFQNGSITLNSTDYFNFTSVTRSGRLSDSWHSFDCRVSFTSFPPLLSKDAFSNFTSSSSLSDAGFVVTVGSYGVDVSLPGGTIDTNAPWDYYNQVILPYIKTIIPTYEPDYFIFPDGYHPDTVPPSQNYPSGGGISIGDQYNIDIDINFPTYPNGEPETDESGETITETVIVSDTRPTDAVFRFTVPTLPGLQIDSTPIPFNTNISEYTNPLLSMFGLITDIFDSSGVLPVIPILFTMGIIFFVIYKCS